MTEVIKGNLVDPSSLDVSKLNSEALVANIQSSGVPLGGGSLVSGSSVYWGKSGNSLLVDTPTTLQIVYSMGVKWLKPLASFREDLAPLYYYNVYKSGDKNYANLSVGAIYNITTSKVIDLQTVRAKLNTNDLYIQDIYTVDISSLSGCGSDSTMGDSIIVYVQSLPSTKDSVVDLSISRKYNLRDLPYQHGDSTAVEYTGVDGIMSYGLKLGSLSTTSNFEVELDVDTSKNCTLFSSDNLIRLEIKNGKITGVIGGHNTVNNATAIDTVYINTENYGGSAQYFTVDADLNGKRTYKWVSSPIQENHTVSRWQVKRVSDNKLFWTDTEKSSTATDDKVPEGCTIYEDVYTYTVCCMAKADQFVYVSPAVQGEITYTVQNHIYCYNGQQQLFDISFKLHRPLVCDIYCLNSTYKIGDSHNVVLVNASNNGISLPEFWTLYDVPEQKSLLNDGTYLVLADNTTTTNYTIVAKSDCKRDPDGLWVNGVVSSKIIVGSFDVVANAIVSAFKYSQV